MASFKRPAAVSKGAPLKRPAAAAKQLPTKPPMSGEESLGEVCPPALSAEKVLGGAGSMNGEKFSIRLRGLNDTGEVVEVAAEESLLTFAVHLRNAKGPPSKCPQLVLGDTVLPLWLSAKKAGLHDGTELTVVWSATPRRPSLPPRSTYTTDVPPRQALDLPSLEKALTEERALDLAGSIINSSVAGSLAAALPASLVSLNIRSCGLKESAMKELFKALPASVVELRAGHNRFGKEAICCLSAPEGGFHVLDIGFTSSYPSKDEPDLELLAPLLGPQTRELGLGGLAFVTPSAVEALAPKCPGLQKLDIRRCGSDWSGDTVSSAWSVLARCCPELEELQTTAPCSEESLRALALRVAVVGELSAAQEPAPHGGERLESLRCECTTTEAAIAAARLEVGWLAIKIRSLDLGENDAPFFVGKNPKFAEALKRSPASDIELELPFFDSAILCAASERLRVLDGSSCLFGKFNHGALPSLVKALRSHTFQNLLVLQICEWEKVDAGDLARVAAACPLLEDVQLNGVERSFQFEVIDEGVLALGQHCRHMRILNLYDRPLKDGPSVLASVCKGWPELRRLQLSRGDWAAGETKVLLDVLASHCPMLERLIPPLVFPAKPEWASWEKILSPTCPFFKNVW